LTQKNQACRPSPVLPEIIGLNLKGSFPEPLVQKNQNSVNKAVTSNHHPASDIPDNNYHKHKKILK